MPFNDYATNRTLRNVIVELKDISDSLKEGNGGDTQTVLDSAPAPLPVFDGRFNALGLKNIGNQRVRLLTPEGVVYTSYSHYMLKSEDWGETWSDNLTDEGDLPQTIRQLGRLDTGELIAACTGGYVYKSDVNETNWRLVLDYEQGGPMADFGFQIFGDIVLTATYGSGMTECAVYLSRDRGETFDVILRIPADGGSDPDAIHHIHDVKFDPYEGLVWVTTGDDYLEANSVKNRIYVSGDWGNTWQHWRGYRATQIIPLPNCVLFVGDNRKRMSIARYDRPLAGTASITDMSPIRDDWPTSKAEDWPIKETWFGAMLPDESTAGHWGTNAAVTYGPNAKAVFGFRHGSVNTQPLKVWATVDGKRFTTVWTSPWIGGSIGGVFGPDNEGNYAVAVYDGENQHLLKLTL